MSKKFVITGGIGFIGTHLARHFMRQGHTVTAVDNGSRPGAHHNRRLLTEGFGSRFHFEYCDVRFLHRADAQRHGYTGLYDVMHAHKPDVVLHLAAQVSAAVALRHPKEDYEHNVVGTRNVTVAMKRACPGATLIFASTNKVYGSDRDGRFGAYKDGVPEDHPCRPNEPYGQHKLDAEEIVREAARRSDQRTVVVRQSCIYGPHQYGAEEQGWVSWLMTAAMMGLPITIFGNGQQVRDLLYVDDLCLLYERTIEALKTRPDLSGHTFNAGGGPQNTRTVMGFVDELRARYPISYLRHAAMREGDQRLFVADTAKARDALGWSPRVEASQGLKRTERWIRTHLDTIADAVIERHLSKPEKAA